MPPERFFSASLGPRERLVTYAVGYGVGMGVPLILGVSFAVGFSQPLLLLFPLPFVIAFGIPAFLRPSGFAVSQREIAVLRKPGRVSIPLDRIHAVHFPATRPPGSSIGLMRVEGMHGVFGSFWNKSWGRFRVYVTNPANSVELRLAGGSRVIVSPDEPKAFLSAVRAAASERGLEVAVNAAE